MSVDHDLMKTDMPCAGFVSRDMLLPDAALIHGRALVCAWEMGLQDVQDNVVKLIILALEVSSSSALPRTVIATSRLQPL